LCKGDEGFTSFSLRVDLRSCDCQGGSNSFWGNNEISVVDEVAAVVVVVVVVVEEKEEVVEVAGVVWEGCVG
jgi:hypothetical protein